MTLPISAGSGYFGYQPTLSFLGLFIGVAARPFFGVAAVTLVVVGEEPGRRAAG